MRRKVSRGDVKLSYAYHLLTVAQALGDAMGDAVRHRLYEFKGTPRTCRARTYRPTDGQTDR